MRPRRIDLQIDTLVLEGFEPGVEHRIRTALQSELVLLLQNDLALAQTTTRQQREVDAGSIRDRSATDPEATGKALARAVHRSLSG